MHEDRILHCKDNIGYLLCVWQMEKTSGVFSRRIIGWNLEGSNKI